MQRNKRKLSKAEIIFYIVILVLTALILLWYFLKPSAGNLVEIRVSGKVIGTYPLNVNQEITIEGKDNGKNILVIRDGKASMTEADCPDKLCVKKGVIYRVSESIICLPHEVVVEIKKDTSASHENSSNDEGDADIIAK